MHDKIIEELQAQLIKEQAKETASQTGIETASQTIVETKVETATETANTAQKQRKTVKLDGLETAEKQDSNNVKKNVETIFENDFENKELREGPGEEIEELENENLEDDPDYIKEGPDPLLDMIYDPGDTTIEEQVEKSTGESTKSLDTLATLGEMVMDYLDNSKAQICAAISGNEPAMYASDQKAKKALVEATKNYVQEIGLKPPTPTQTFLIAVGMWLLPSLGLATLERFKLMPGQKEKEATPSPTAPVTPAPTAPSQRAAEPAAAAAAPQTEAPLQEEKATKVDYTQTKEFKTGRRLFERHAKGTYRRLSNGHYANVSLATEYPSPEILELLEAGYSNEEIRGVLYGE